MSLKIQSVILNAVSSTSPRVTTTFSASEGFAVLACEEVEGAPSVLIANDPDLAQDTQRVTAVLVNGPTNVNDYVGMTVIGTAVFATGTAVVFNG